MTAVSAAGCMPHPAPPARGRVEIGVSDPDAVVQLRPATRVDTGIVSCRGGCVAEISPGRYRLTVQPTARSIGGSDDIDIVGPSRIDVRPRAVQSRTTAAGMLISGAALIVGGAVLFGLSKSVKDVDGCVFCMSPGQAIGALSIAGGLVIVPIGLALGSKTSPDVDVTPTACTPGGQWRTMGGGVRGAF